MVCPKCKFENQSAAVFCSRCGTNLVNPPSFWRRHRRLILILIFVVLPFIGLSRSLSSMGREIGQAEDEAAYISGSGSDKIAVVNVDGVIVEAAPQGGFGSFSDGVATARKFKQTLGEVKNDSAVKALLVRVNSPGGSAVAAEEMHASLKEFKRDTHLPVVVYFGDVAASGGYYLSTPADAIIANPNTLTGSIGVVISYLNFTDIAQKYGVKSVVYKSGTHKDIGNEFRSPSSQEESIMQALISDAFANFIKVVKDGRHLSDDQLKNISDGRIISAKQAQELNLIDGVGTFEVAVTRARELAQIGQAKVVEFGHQSFVESLLGSTSQKIRLSLLPGMDNLSPLTQSGILYLYTR